MSATTSTVCVHQFTVGDALAAALRDIAHRLDYVLAHAGTKLDGVELHELCRASRELDEMILALTAKDHPSCGI